MQQISFSYINTILDMSSFSPHSQPHSNPNPNDLGGKQTPHLSLIWYNKMTESGPRFL